MEALVKTKIGIFNFRSDMARGEVHDLLIDSGNDHIQRLHQTAQGLYLVNILPSGQIEASIAPKGVYNLGEDRVLGISVSRQIIVK